MTTTQLSGKRCNGDHFIQLRSIARHGSSQALLLLLLLLLVVLAIAMLLLLVLELREMSPIAMITRCSLRWK